MKEYDRHGVAAWDMVVACAAFCAALCVCVGLAVLGSGCVDVPEKTSATSSTDTISSNTIPNEIEIYSTPNGLAIAEVIPVCEDGVVLYVYRSQSGSGLWGTRDCYVIGKYCPGFRGACGM
jgi:hypothetical protein